MKTTAYIVNIIFLLILNDSFAEDFTINELNDFHKRKNTCYIAVATSMAYETKITNKDKVWSGRRVMCVADTTVAKGTIKEKSGCSFFILDFETGNINTSYFHGEDSSKLNPGGLAMVNKKCADGGWEELIKVYPGLAYGKSIAQALVKGADIGILLGGHGIPTDTYFTATQVLESSTPQLLAWWKESRVIHLEENLKQEKLKSKKEK